MLSLVLKRYFRGTSQLISVTLLTSIFICLVTVINLAIDKTETASVAKSLSSSNFAQSGVSATFAGDFSEPDSVEIDNSVRGALQGLGIEDPDFFVTYRPIVNSTGQTFHLVGISKEDLTVTSGKIPSTCSSTDCQVALVSGEAVELPQGFASVGTADLGTSAVSDLTLQAGIPVYVTADISGILKQPLVAQMPRTIVWAAPVSSSYLKRVGPEVALKEMRETANQFSLQSARLELKYPEVEITNAVIQSSAATSRLSQVLLVVGLMSLLGLAVLGQIAQPKTLAAARVLQQIRGKKQTMLTWASAAVALLPPLALGLVLHLLFEVPLLPMALFLVAAFIILGISLSFDAKWGYGLLVAVATVLAFMQNEPVFIGAIILPLAFLILSRLDRNLWRHPIELATYRRIELRAIAAFVGIASIAITSWIVTASSLDKQELNRISFLTPLTTTVSGLQSGVLQEVSLAEYESYGRTIPVEVLSSTSSGTGTSLENIQVVGIPADADLGHMTEIGGPGIDQLASIVDGESMLGVSGANQLLNVSQVPDRTELGVWVIDENGQSLRIPITQVITSEMKILGVEVSETSKDQERREHATGEGSHAISLPAGTVEFELPSGEVIHKDVVLSDGAVYLPVAKSATRLKAIVSPQLGAAGDSIVVNLAKDLSVELEVLSNADRFPTVSGAFAVIDQQSLNSYLAQTRPELIRISQVWVDGETPNNDPRFNKLQVTSRASLEHDFSTDPIRLEIRRMYFAVTILLILGILGITMLLTMIAIRQANISEWIGRGEAETILRRGILRVILVVVSVAGIVGVGIGLIAASSLISKDSLTWAGLTAMPPVAMHISIATVASWIFVLLGSVVAGVLLGGVRRGN